MRYMMSVLLTFVFALLCATATAGDDSFGEAMPADGGAPFAAYLDRLRAVHEADWDAFKRLAPPGEVSAQIAAAGGEEAAKAEFLEFAEFLAMMTPHSAEFVEGRADDQSARFHARVITKSQSGDDVKLDRDIEMINAEGVWILENETPR